MMGDEQEISARAAVSGEVIGRTAELARLGELVHSRPEGTLVALTGEAGMGKTTLVKDFTHTLEGEGWLIVSARTWEAVDAPPYWPWIQVLRDLFPPASQNSAAVDAAAAGMLARLVPQSFSLAGDGEDGDSSSHRFELFEAVVGALAAVARRQKLAIVLEDLHAADESSILLLRYVAHELERDQAFLVATWDPRALGNQTWHAEAFAGLARESEHLALSGLPRSDVGLLYESITGENPSEAIVGALFEATEGNPLFVAEATKVLTERGNLHRPDYSVGFRVPEGVRGMIRRRLDALASDSTELLSVASIIGRQFDVSLLLEVTGLELDTALSLLDAAVSAGVIEESGALGRYSFAHILIRETLYEGMTAAQRMRLHRAVAEAIESALGSDPGDRMSELAHHWFKAAQAGDLSKALSFTRAAAERAVTQQAYEEAARLFGRALKVAETGRPGDVDELRARLEEVRRTAGMTRTVTKAPSETIARFEREGDFWTIAYLDATTRLKDSKGLRYIAELLVRPGGEVHVLELVRAGSPADPGRGAKVAPDEVPADPFGDAGAMLDETAKKQYRRRIEDLQAEIDEADSFNDPERAARAREELDLLAHELAAGVGLGGRDRKAASAAERARVSVTKTIRDALKKIDQNHPALGRHLMTTLKTGTFCRYDPDPRVPINWQV